MRKIFRITACVAAWALLLYCAVSLWAVADYYRAIPEQYNFYGAEALAELQAKGLIWVIVQTAGFLISAAVCFAVTRNAWKKRNNLKEKCEHCEHDEDKAQTE